MIPRVLVPLLAAAAFPHGSGCSPYTQDKPVPPESSSPTPSRLVEITATDERLNPSRIFARPGESLAVAFRNEGTRAHRLVFELPAGELKLAEDVPAGASARMTFRVPDAAGNYVYFCPEDNQRRQRIKGTLGVRQPPAVALAVHASGLTAPVMLVSPPDNTGRLFIVDQTGTVWVMTPGLELLATPFVDLRNAPDKLVHLNPDYDERGLLGMAFHPDYAKNGRFYLYYTAPPRTGAVGMDHTNRLSEWKGSTGDIDVADPASERVLLAIDQPQANHNGGMLAFGPSDKYLYLSLGDGGGAGDIDPGHTPGIGNGQDRGNLLGSILRIDVNHGNPYGIPADNPFSPGAQEPGAPEIYAYGLRNPYRFSFDMGTHALYASDAGQELWEEVNLIERGRNYGWNILEGTHCFNREDFLKPLVSCANTGPYGEQLQGPIVEFPNARQNGGLGQAVIGGYVYRGRALDALRGRYVFGTFGGAKEGPGGTLLAAGDPSPDGGLWPFESIHITPGGELGHYLRGFGQDSEGEMYILTSDSIGPSGRTGKVSKLVAP